MTDLPPLPLAKLIDPVPYGIRSRGAFGHSDDTVREYGAACAAAARAGEREACALALERTGNDHCAAAIRARGEAP